MSVHHGCVVKVPVDLYEKVTTPNVLVQMEDVESRLLVELVGDRLSHRHSGSMESSWMSVLKSSECFSSPRRRRDVGEDQLDRAIAASCKQ